MNKGIIGKHVEIINSSNPTLIGLNGIINDETQHSITILTITGEKQILKTHVVLNINGERVDGKTLKGKPEDRMK